jgi:hypothetical protein
MQVLLLALICGYNRCVYSAIADHQLTSVRFIILSALFAIAGAGQLFTIYLLRLPQTVHRDEWTRSINLVFTFLCWLVLNVLLKVGFPSLPPSLSWGLRCSHFTSLGSPSDCPPR